MKIALFTYEAFPNARAVRQLLADHAKDIVYVGSSDVHRPNVGGFWAPVKKLLSQSGFGILPFMLVNFVFPEFIIDIFSYLHRFRSTKDPRAVPLANLCKQHNIPVHIIQDVNHPSVAAALRKAEVDLIISFHFDQIFKQPTLDSAKLGGINVHPSLLPLHRGPCPTIHALNEHPTPIFGATVHVMATKIDTGPILEQIAVSLPEDTSATAAEVRMFEEGRVCLDRVLEKIRQVGRIPAGQAQPMLTYCPWPSRKTLAEVYAKKRRLVSARDWWECFALCSPRGFTSATDAQAKKVE